MDDNQVKSKFVNVPIEVNDEVLNTLCGVLNNNISGRSSESITLPMIMKMQSEMGEYEALIPAVMKCVYEIIGDVGVDNVHIDGVENMLEYPEYADTSKLRELLSLFEKKEDLVELVQGSDTDSVSVYIGGEEDTPVVSNSSIIVKPLKRNNNIVGAIGVVGPNRMEYPKVVKIVDYVADMINRLLSSNTLTDGEQKKKEGDGDG